MPNKREEYEDYYYDENDYIGQDLNDSGYYESDNDLGYEEDRGFGVIDRVGGKFGFIDSIREKIFNLDKTLQSKTRGNRLIAMFAMLFLVIIVMGIIFLVKKNF